ncbi:MAG: ribosome small subunit-dependent GTPase A, partial [Spirochaetes bacterium]|nr:ribosome small subunit-dependent GTPase A [Spirochaetota bacterium]
PDGTGLDGLRRFLRPGATSVLLGSSGSGKSTLLNALAGNELNATGPVREYDQRGRHTTTSRTLFSLPSGAMIIDTPGLREVQLWLGEESVGAVFSEIEEAAASCRFSDCSHSGEPGCAVLAGLADGSIAEERYRSWQRLAREARFLETKTNVLARREEKDSQKRRSRRAKAYNKNR